MATSQELGTVCTIIHYFYEPVDFSNLWRADGLDQDEGIQSAFRIWSEHVGTAVDRSFSFLHKDDPLRFQQDGLPVSYKGRCKLLKPKTVTSNTPVKSDRHGAYSPPSEIFSLQSRLKKRQVRRFQSLYRRLKSLPRHLSDSPHGRIWRIFLMLSWNGRRSGWLRVMVIVGRTGFFLLRLCLTWTCNYLQWGRWISSHRSRSWIAITRVWKSRDRGQRH